MKRLSATDCDWILIIDDDAMIAPDYIAELKKAILSHEYLDLLRHRHHKGSH